jgi:hypothetical protein
MPINKVGSKGIADGSIATADLNDGIVTSAKLQDGTVTNDKLTNTAFTLSGTSVSLGGSATFANKFVDWQSVITADGSTGTTGVAGRGYFINTTSAAHTFTLPSSATRGDTIAIKDYAGTFATFNLTIARNGHKIQGVENNSLISTNRASVVLVYVDVTRGWEFVEESNVADLQAATFISATGGTVTTSGNFKIHTFTGDGCFVVATVGNPVAGPAGSNVDYLVVAGGGGGGKEIAGGGGAGGFRTTFPSPGCNAGSFPISATTFPITVGGGGAGSTANTSRGTSGSNSVFSTITSTGGGGGGSNSSSPSNVAVGGASGGSGGGGAGSAQAPTPLRVGGTGNSPPVNPPQGNTGGAGSGPGAPYGGGGGGGVTGVGGAGSANSISGSPVSYAGGGGGTNFGTGAAGGTGGGGAGSNQACTVTGTAGTVNTGGGGGGGTDSINGLAGGSGIVIIRYKFQ